MTIDQGAACRCPHCDEPVVETDRSREMPLVNAKGKSEIGTWHHECLARVFLGSVGHQRRECGCYGGTYDDPPGMTRREAAIAAARQAGVYRERVSN